MRTVVTTLLLALALVGCAHTRTAPVVGVGLGKGIITNQFGSHEAFERSGRVGLAIEHEYVYVKPEAGYYLAFGEGRRHSGWFSLIGGFRARLPIGLTGYMGVGPTYLTTPDGVALSGRFQFNIQTAICWEDKSDMLGICFPDYFHLSNAGIVLPNRGIDAIGMSVILRSADLWAVIVKLFGGEP